MAALAKRYDIIATVVLFLLAIPAERFELLSMLEQQADSFRQPMRTQVQLSDDIVFVNLDEAFFDAYGSWPLRREDLGRIALNLRKLGARVVGVDMLFDFPSSYGEDEKVAALFAEAGKVAMVSQALIEDGRVVGMNYPVPVIRKVVRTGYSNIQSSAFLVEHMSRIRVYDNSEFEPKDEVWPFAVQVLALYEGFEPRLQNGELVLGGREIPLDEHGDFIIDFPVPRAGQLSFAEGHRISALDVLQLPDASTEEGAELLSDLHYALQDKLVLFGDTSELSHDYFNTPIGTTYGVEIIGATINTLMQGAPLRPVPWTWEAAVFLLLMAALVYTAFQANPVPRVLVAGGTFLLWLVVVCWLYASHDLVFSMSYAMVAGTLGFLLINLRFYLQERGQKSLIRDAFGQYLSPKVVNILVKDPSRLSLGGERRNMTAYFSDVAGFSTISEALSPDELVALLNDYLTRMCDIIADYDGTVDKFEGDAIIAFWGAPLDQPDHARLACYAAIDMQKTLSDYRRQLADAGQPILNVRMGINTGDMLVGNLGSRQRMDYTIMGDAVNLAARLEGANKFYGTDTMISQFTYDQVADAVEVRELDLIRVVGKKEAVRVYQLLDRKGQLDPVRAKVRSEYESGLAAYKAGRFEEAIAAFERALHLVAADGPSLTYIARCKQYLQNPPPADWDGVYELTEKG